MVSTFWQWKELGHLSETPGLGQKTAQWTWIARLPESREATNDYWSTSKRTGDQLEGDQLEGAPIDQKWEFLSMIKNKGSNGDISKMFKTKSSWQNLKTKNKNHQSLPLQVTRALTHS